MQKLIYAIDFGTSNSLLSAATEETCFSPLALDPLQKDPSILKTLFYTRDGVDWSFGVSAISDYEEWGNEGRLFRSLKRFLPEEHFKGTVICDRFFKIEDLIAVFLRHMREKANAFFSQNVTSVVLGRPALFSMDEKKDALAEKRLYNAAIKAGFSEISFCKEPVAAALDFSEHLKSEKKVLIADFGGGTSDFTVIKMSQGPLKREDVLGLGGLSIAGDAFDGALMRDEVACHFGTEVVYQIPMGKNKLTLPRPLIEKLCSPSGIMFLNQQDILEFLRHAQYWSLSLEDNKRMNRLFTLIEEQLGYRLFQSIERLKIDLSEKERARFIFDYPDIEIMEWIGKEAFGKSSVNLVEEMMEALFKTLKEASLTPKDIDLVCMTGGTAKLLLLGQKMEAIFGSEKIMSYRHFHSIIDGITLMAQRKLRGEDLF